MNTLIGVLMGRIYKPLDFLSEGEIKKILESNEINEIIRLPLSVGQNYPNWKFAQDLCIKLSEYPDERVRVNAILGLSYIARTKRKLEKYIVKPVVLKALKEQEEHKWRIINAIEDINLFMKWDIGKKALVKENQQAQFD